MRVCSARKADGMLREMSFRVVLDLITIRKIKCDADQVDSHLALKAPQLHSRSLAPIGGRERSKQVGRPPARPLGPPNSFKQQQQLPPPPGYQLIHSTLTRCRVCDCGLTLLLVVVLQTMRAAIVALIHLIDCFIHPLGRESKRASGRARAQKMRFDLI